MPIEQSHGKARPTLPRATDLRPLPTVSEPTRNRDARGRFLPGNGVANGRGVRELIKRHLGRDAVGPELEQLYREVRLLFVSLMKQLPSDAAQVQDLVARQARSSVLASRFAARAADLGYDTPAGHKALELSLKLDARAERNGVTAWDIATKLVDKNRKHERRGAVANIKARAAERKSAAE